MTNRAKLGRPCMRKVTWSRSYASSTILEVTCLCSHAKSDVLTVMCLQ